MDGVIYDWIQKHNTDGVNPINALLNRLCAAGITSAESKIHRLNNPFIRCTIQLADNLEQFSDQQKISVKREVDIVYGFNFWSSYKSKTMIAVAINSRKSVDKNRFFKTP